MLYRKIESKIKNHFLSGTDKILFIQGARQVGKSFIIRKVGSELYTNFIEINLAEDKEGPKFFENVHTVEDFYITLSAISNNKLGTREDTLVFLDEIQEYAHLFTLLKFLRQDSRFTYIASGSLLGVTLRQTTSVPVGSISTINMYPLDFEEFLIANGYGPEVLAFMRKQFEMRQPLQLAMHNRTLDLFRKYLICGGMPEAVDMFVREQNIAKIRDIQRDIIRMYKIDASKYDESHRLRIRRIYDMIPSALENKKKRIVAKEIEGKEGAKFERYEEDFEYIISSGIALAVRAISNPKFPLLESTSKNLLKLYLNDVGLLSCLLYSDNIFPILNTEKSINLGSVYESAVAQELASHNERLFYYDNKSAGEVDFLTDDYNSLSVLPIEVKSGKDYTRHSALSRFVKTPDYCIKKAFVLSNERETRQNGNIWYLPIYYVMYVEERH